MKNDHRLSLQKLRWAYRVAFVVSFVLLGFAYRYASMATEFSDLAGASQAYGAASTALGMAGLLGAMVAAALQMIVRHIDALESELAKFVENDADPKLAARTLADFLRKMREIEPLTRDPRMNEGN